MEKDKSFDTLSQAINALTKDGYEEGFTAGDEKIIGSISKKEYVPTDLKIVSTYRFEGMTNPQDETIVFAIEAIDGRKGTLVMSYSAEHNQNVELIKEIPQAKN
ncbi:MAG: phosphoribosylpyrophosphate synthetase [Reichenbachiella sp.]|uniref:phosphoribosylpyrophosphate synthetase n=1 Tax=Reichenbachiella sp. TaxID=2184521 RepID=UPI0032987A70